MSTAALIPQAFSANASETSWSEIVAQQPGSVLLQRAPSRAFAGRSLLFRNPEHILEAWQPEDVARVLGAIEPMLAQGYHLAGYVAYEAGFALEPTLSHLLPHSRAKEPYIWLGCYRTPQIRQDAYNSPQACSTQTIIAPRFSLDQETYERQVERVRSLIAAGETYQLNLTLEATWETQDTAATLYERLLRAQPVPYAALLHPAPDWHVLSLSPELFFERRGDRLCTRPMKGTAAPGKDLAETRAQAAALQRSEKDRAENLMIVDLLRNDLGRICRLGSVQATRLFEVERYPSVLQMTSTIEGTLREQVTYGDLFHALFPSGSIVGAPKIHGMRLLHGLENRRRGVYTGAIGYISPQQQAEFNVAIRTVSLRQGTARLGVGSGVTYDSDPALEYAECLTKTAFLRSQPEPPFALIETLLLEDGSYALLEEHLARLQSSAEYFDFIANEAHIREVLQQFAACWLGGNRARVRLLLNKTGAVTCTGSKLEAEPALSVDLLLWDEKTSADDRLLRHKTTHRPLYHKAFQDAQARGFADSVFRNTQDEMTEGAIHNLVLSAQGTWCTPPLRCGVLPGTFRQFLLQSGRLHEKVLTIDDVLRADAMYVCNSVRGLRRVRSLVERNSGRDQPRTLWTDPHLQDL